MANPHYDPKDIGKTKAPAKTDPNEPYLKDLDQRWFSELSTKYERGDTELKAKVAKLARDVPELRQYLVPLLRQASSKKAYDTFEISFKHDRGGQHEIVLNGFPQGNGSLWFDVHNTGGFELEFGGRTVKTFSKRMGLSSVKSQVLRALGLKGSDAEAFGAAWADMVQSLKHDFGWDFEDAFKLASQAKSSKLMARQEAILKKYVESTSHPEADFDDLPSSVRAALEAVKDQETLWSDVNRWLGDNANPHLKSKWAATTKVAHKPILMSEGLTKEAVRDGRAFMVYKVDPDNNNSKFYEGLIVPSGMGFALIRRWGALTDSGQTGRIDGAKFDDDPRSQFPTLNAAKMELRKHFATRVSHGYTDAFGADHTTPDGHKLPMGEYPVGLTRKPGFGWGSQSITQCSPVLHDLGEALSMARSEIQMTGRSDAIKDKLEGAVTALRTLAHTDSTMASKIAAAMSKVLRRLSGSPRFLPDPEGRAMAAELQTIQRYVSKQMSLCS